jgi:LAGLIDADG DNA endonuclease family
LTNTNPKITNRKPDARTGKVYNSIRFSTLCLPCLNYYHELFYSNGKKIISNNIGELLTARGLAYLIMDDGSKSYYGQTIIHTRSYTKLEVELLQETIFKNFGLTSRLEEKLKDQYILYIQVKQDFKKKLYNLVRPYMHDSMMYKL